jgi:hypothetical protein
MADTEQVCTVGLLYLILVNTGIRNRKRNERLGIRRNGERRQRKRIPKSGSACRRMTSLCVKVVPTLNHASTLMPEVRKETRKEKPCQGRAETHRNNEGTRGIPRD